MWDFLEFRRMMTPAIIQVLFLVGCLVVIALGVLRILDGSVASGLAVIILGPFLLRMASEILIVVFRIHSAIVSIEDKVEDIWGDSERA